MLDFVQYCILIVLASMVLINAPVQKNRFSQIVFGVYTMLLAILGVAGLVADQLRQYFVLAAGLPISVVFLRLVYDKGFELILSKKK